jgi:membrane protease YdiL (CAAX protease family)
VKKYLTGEIKSVASELKKLDFQTIYILLSVCIIIFISFTLTNPSFYFKYIQKDFLNSRIYWLLADGLLMFLIPVLSIKFIFKKNLKDFGFRIGDFKFGLITVFVFFIVMLPVLWIVSSSETFASSYPQGGAVLKENFLMFIIFEICIIIYMLGWEFLWRGYCLFGLFKVFGLYSIFIQMIPFFILHKGKPDIELFASIFAGIILGIQAYKSKSFIYCWIIHSLVMVSIDSISVIRYINKYYNILF